MLNRIEFYKNRNIGERFSVAIDFLKQNWKVLYKNILLGGLPLALIMSFLMVRDYSNTVDAFFILLVSFLNWIYIFAMTGAVLVHYEQNQLTETTGWSDLQGTFFRLAGKATIISLIAYIPLIVVLGGFAGVLFATMFLSNGTVIGISVFLFCLLIIGVSITFAPSMILLYFPAFFSGKTNLESIKVSFSLGFKNWGSLFVVILLTGIIFSITYMIFSVPFQIIILFSKGGISFITFIFAGLSVMGILLLTPLTILIFAFQYFSIVEKAEGVSLQSQLNEFEKL